MREILFRAWNGHKMITDGLVIYNGDLYMDWRDFEDGITSDNPLMQYTGLKDKNGVKIFEGDVMSINYDDDDEPGIVVWDAEELEYGIDLGNVQLKMGCHYPNQLEVVGNIHDNPELLGGVE